MQEKRPVLKLFLFFEEPSSSDRKGRPVTRPISRKPVHETSVIKTRSSEDRKDFNIEQTHERTGRLVITHDVINVSDSSQTRSAHESETFNVEDEILSERTERSVADHDMSHESMMVNASQSLSMSSRREDLMDIDMVKSRKTKNIIRLTN